ncbi:MAG: hypothetical protein JXR77_19520 [Lentisphaeria bacterium]|nr:hypothetical protein [Lentisphaeria bacterium]
MTSPPEAADTFRWFFAEDAPGASKESLRSGAWTREAVFVKGNRRRSIFRVPGAPGLIVKVDRPPGLADRLKALWRNAGAREFTCLRAVAATGLPVPRAVGWARRGRETLFAAIDLEPCEKLRTAWERARNDTGMRERLLPALQRFAAAFARARIVHPDMHTGNILVKDAGSRTELFLVDLAGARVLPPGREARPWHTAGWLTQLAPDLRPHEARRLLDAAGLLTPGSPANDLWPELLRRYGHETARRWRGRRCRLLATSSLCTRIEAREGLWLLRHPLDPTELMAALPGHRRQSEVGNMLKVDRKRRLSRVALPSGPVVVKEFVGPGLGLWRADRRSWFCHYRMMPDVLPVCRCLGWLRGEDGHGYLVLEDVGTRSVRDAAAGLPASARRPLLRAAMHLVAWLHLLGIRHRDLKATNFVLRDAGRPGFPVTLVDCDAVRFDTTLTDRDRARALRQFLDNLPPGVSSREKLRAAVAYRQEACLDRARLRRILRAGNV